jgi:hypothetical protein
MSSTLKARRRGTVTPGGLYLPDPFISCVASIVEGKCACVLTLSRTSQAHLYLVDLGPPFTYPADLGWVTQSYSPHAWAFSFVLLGGHLYKVGIELPSFIFHSSNTVSLP